ncbi:hypothetical protein GCM10009716_42510 [Streptomyces sodiiphilus]|uniref:Uncharacterized protein n=1 Tax=Streptomyces sodiiphilus TaxID=226217 RepID=A0ABP5B4H0_9ACTN
MLLAVPDPGQRAEVGGLHAGILNQGVALGQCDPDGFTHDRGLGECEFRHIDQCHLFHAGDHCRVQHTTEDGLDGRDRVESLGLHLSVRQRLLNSAVQGRRSPLGIAEPEGVGSVGCRLCDDLISLLDELGEHRYQMLAERCRHDPLGGAAEESSPYSSLDPA